MEDRGRATGPSDFGALLRRHRLAAGLSQEALAERARMSSHGVSALERGHRRSPQRETLALLVRALALSDEDRREFETAAVRPPWIRRGGGGGISVGPWSEPAELTLPVALKSFVGRELEIAEIASLLSAHRFVTVTGTGGIGKTQTALQVARGLREFETVQFVDLASITSGLLIVNTIASALNVQELPNRSAMDALVAFLRHKTILLMLDNCEHIIDSAASAVNQLLQKCPNLRILATSREALRTAGERAYRLPPMSSEHSVQLFIDRMRAVDFHAKPSPSDLAIVTELCQRLDGMPLAIEMAAARVETLTLRDISAMLQKRFALLTAGDRAAPSRQQTMLATLEWSYQMLSKGEQALFDRLSVFRGGCTLEVATAVCGSEGQERADVGQLLSTLTSKSLVVTDRSSSRVRYTFLESVREFALGRLEGRGELCLLAQRHATEIAGIAADFDRAFVAGGEDVWRPLLEVEKDNVRAALQWSLAERNDVRIGQQIVGRLKAAFWRELGSFRTEGAEWIRLALDLVDEHTPGIVRANLEYAAAAGTMFFLWRFEEALTGARRAVELYRSHNDFSGSVRAELLCAAGLESLGNIEGAKAVLDEVLAKTRRPGMERDRAVCLLRLGYVHSLRRELTEGRRCVLEAREIFRASGESVYGAEEALSWLAFLAGDAELALDYIKGALRSVGEIGEASDVELAPTYLLALARYDEAELTAQKMLDACVEKSDGPMALLALQHLAAIAAERPQTGEELRSRTRVAARILGFVDRRLKALGTKRRPYHEPGYNRLLARLRDSIDESELMLLFEIGSKMETDKVVELARAVTGLPLVPTVGPAEF